MRVLSRLAPALLCALLGHAAVAAEGSRWAAGLHAKARLLAGGEADGARLAAVEIAPERGFKTYWRHPGESGLPPAFDWSRSTNLAAVEVLWPAPRRFEDGGGVSYGYEGGVVLPLRVTPRDADRPVGLALTLDYGVCKDICIPVRADLFLPVPAGGSAVPPPAIGRALLAVPERRVLGANGDLSILAVEPAGAGRPQLLVTVRAPAPPQIFAEGPEGWFLSAPAGAPGWPHGGSVPRNGSEPAHDSVPANVTVPVSVDERPSEAAGPVPIRLTVTAGGRAIETEARLDPGALAPGRPRLDGAAGPR
jgi:DsbC/DsbD-like thiol-disulfide interchange protein